MNDKLLLIGGGGHCKSVLDCLLKTNQYAEIGIIDKNENIGKIILGIPIIGCDDNLIELYESGYNCAFITLGSIGKASFRIKLFSLIEKIGFIIPNIIDSSAIISEHVNMKNGIFIGKNAVVNADAFIGKGSIINTSTIIEHDCVIGEFAHISPGAVLCGEVQIGANSHIGANSVIKQCVIIGENTTIGMGSVVLHDIAGSMLAYGNPCKEVKQI
jgi:sugar O-acyltransferase (sialic acid O-acetyltransferase NeuD family)